jgi:hypothetical protein
MADSVVQHNPTVFHAADNVTMSLFAIYPEDLDPSYSQTAGALNGTRIRQVYSRSWLHVELGSDAYHRSVSCCGYDLTDVQIFPIVREIARY